MAGYRKRHRNSGLQVLRVEKVAEICHHVTSFPANWKKHGKSAGPIRNQLMLDVGKPDLVIAFPGGSGTADMIRRARKAGVPVKEIPA
jgi:acyl-CoA synthetase (NDP forming)